MPNAREWILLKYEVLDGAIAEEKSPYYGEPLYVPYYWHKHGDMYDGDPIHIRTTTDERALFPELEDKLVVVIDRREDGHVEETDELLL